MELIQEHVATSIIGKRKFDRYRCSCGKIFNTCRAAVKKGRVKSCGCSRRKKGFKNPQEYIAWIGMRARCHNKNHSAYKHYGARGIFVCDRWMNSFENFIEDMGEKPTKNHTLERIDNNKGYNPKNCEWATWKKQSKNKRGFAVFEYEKTRYTAKEMAYKLGITTDSLNYRYYQKKMSLKEIMEELNVA